MSEQYKKKKKKNWWIYVKLIIYYLQFTISISYVSSKVFSFLPLISLSHELLKCNITFQQVVKTIVNLCVHELIILKNLIQ